MVYNKLEFVQENERHKIKWDFEKQIDPLIMTRGPELVVINKKKRTCHLVHFAVQVDHNGK